MTIEEANEKAKLLEKLNLRIWQIPDTNEQNRLRSMFKACSKSILSNGFNIRKSKKYDPTLGYMVPKFKVVGRDHDRILEIVDNRPVNSKYKKDCTTRCISLCTGVDYDTIRKEQLKNSENELYSGGWRFERNWSKSFISRGFTKITLPKKISRKTFLRLFKDKGINDGIIGSLSSGHIAAIDMKKKKILDMYNSSGGRITALYVPESQKDAYQKAIEKVF